MEGRSRGDRGEIEGRSRGEQIEVWHACGCVQPMQRARTATVPPPAAAGARVIMLCVVETAAETVAFLGD